MQRLFSTFPEGRPGAGLVLLRALAAIPMAQFIIGPNPTTHLTMSLQLLCTAASALLIIGLWTPVAGLLLAVSEMALLFFSSGNASMSVVVGAVGAALSLIGPGAWSLDALLFGRKRIRIP